MAGKGDSDCSHFYQCVSLSCLCELFYQPSWSQLRFADCFNSNWLAGLSHHAPGDLSGLCGALAVFLPVLLLVLPSGYVAEHYDRRMVSACCFALEALAALGLFMFSLGTQTHVWPVFMYLSLLGVASAFLGAVPAVVIGGFGTIIVAGA